MFERRETRRVDVNTAISLSVEGLTVSGDLLNFSNDGALFKVSRADEEKLTTMDLGKAATFVLKLKSSPDREYTGEIIRLFFRREHKHIALRFWKKYRELPTS